MADNVTLPATGTGTATPSVATDEIQVSGTGTLGHVQYVKLVDGTLNGTGAIGGDATNGLDVDVTRLPSLVAGSANIGDVDVLTVPADPFGANADAASATGSISAKLRFIAGTGIPITGSVTVGSHAVTNAGTFAVQAAGDIAHDAADNTGGGPQKIGGVAIAHGTNPTAVAAADRTNLYANRAGVLFTIGGHPNVVSYTHSAITTAVTDSALVTIASGLKIVVTRLTVTLDNASTVFPTVKIGFGTSTIAAIGNVGIIYSHGGFPAGGGQTIGDGSGILAVGADNEDLRITTTGNATGNGLQVMVSYYTIET